MHFHTRSFFLPVMQHDAHFSMQEKQNVFSTESRVYKARYTSSHLTMSTYGIYACLVHKCCISLIHYKIVLHISYIENIDMCNRKLFRTPLHSCLFIQFKLIHAFNLMPLVNLLNRTQHKSFFQVLSP